MLQNSYSVVVGPPPLTVNPIGAIYKQPRQFARCFEPFQETHIKYLLNRKIDSHQNSEKFGTFLSYRRCVGHNRYARGASPEIREGFHKHD
jgi:hypothetical protein